MSYLNRPINEVVYIDFSDESVEFHKENCIILKPFEGDVEDRELLDILPFLERKFFLIFQSFFLNRFGKVLRRCKVRD